jgi:hypothetical protein
VRQNVRETYPNLRVRSRVLASRTNTSACPTLASICIATCSSYKRKKQIAYCQCDWGHRRAGLSSRLGATRFQCSLDALAKSINAVTFSTFPYTSFTTLHIPTRARSSRKNSPRMSLKVPKAGGPDLFKAGYKYMSGLEEAVLRNIQAVGELTEIVRTSFGPNGE